MKRLLLALACLLPLPLQAAAWTDSAPVAELFRQAGVTGTFVLFDPDTCQDVGHDEVRARERFTPVSTFKVTNALIGLSLGVVRDILLLEQGAGWKLYGKTGWQNAPGPGIGWWVGCLEKDGQVRAFALNMDLHGASDAPKRMEPGKASLRALGLF